MLIVIGSRLDNILTAYDQRGFARGARKVMVDIDANEIDKLDMDFEVAIAADAGCFLEALKAALSAEALPEERYADWRERCQDWKRRYGVATEVELAEQGPVNHYQVVEALSETIPPQTLVSTGSSGLAVEVFYTVFRNKPGQRVFLTSGLGSMGYGLPAAIGACFANGCQPMVALESDGSLQLNLQELATLRAFNLPICLVILNNAGYASIRNTQRNYFSGRYVGTGPEAGLWLPDLEALANTYQLPFARIKDAAELRPVMDAAVKSRQAILVDARIIPDESLAPKVAAMPQADGSMLSMPMEDMSPLLSLEQLKAEMMIPLTEATLRVRSVEGA